MSTSTLERELTCSICADLLYDPVTFLDCLHTNCGSCAKSWFQSLAAAAAAAPVASSSAPPNTAKYTCPVCRGVVRATKFNPVYQSLIEDFVSRNPEKGRTAEEKAAIRRVYTPAGGVLPSEISTAAPAAAATPGQSRSRPPPPLRRTSAVSPPGRSSGHGSGSNLGSFPPLPLPPPPPPPLPSLHPPPPPPPDERMSVRPLQAYLATLLPTTNQACHHCRKRIDFAARVACAECGILVCYGCLREGRRCFAPPNAAHTLMPHKLQLSPRRITAGIICDVCECWCDNDDGRHSMNSYFWACAFCDGGGWVMCRECVRRGFICSHEITLWTNSRIPSRGPVFGMAVNAGNGNVPADPDNAVVRMTTQLAAMGYVRARGFQTMCDSCEELIPADHSYLHCPVCLEGNWDTCMRCWYALDPDPTDDDEDGYRCAGGHNMILLSQNGTAGTLKIIQDAPHSPPEFIPREEREMAKSAVAVRGHWPETAERREDTEWEAGERMGVRARDYGGLLAFPVGAEITGVVMAFSEGSGRDGTEVQYMWGWYAGIGGVFPRGCVRIVQSGV